MNKRIIIYLTVSVLCALGFAACNSAQTKQYRPMTKITAEELNLVLPKLVPPQMQAQLAGNPQQIEAIVKQIKEVLAIAAEARKAGVADEPEMKQQFDFTASQVVAIGFERDKNKDAQMSVPFADIKAEEIEAFYKESGNEAKFNSFLDIIKKQYAASQPPGSQPTELTEAQIKQAREQWAKTLITERKAVAAGFDKKRETALQIQLQQASLLAQEYSRRKDKEFDVSDEVLNEYIKQHPEFDTSQKRAKAEEILKQAKAGADFAALAKEFSEDPGSKDKGGLYEDVKKGQFVPEFEKAAFALEKGQIAPNLVESQFGYHIIKLENKKTTKDKEGKAEETFSARHILISTTGAPNPQNPYAPPKNLKEAARDNIKKEKRDKWVEELAAQHQISVPAASEVKIEAPAVQQPPAGFPPATNPNSANGNK